MKVLIIESKPIARTNLRNILNWREQGFNFLKETDNGEDGMRILSEMQPELVLLGARLPDMSGAGFAKEARGQGYKGGILILAGYMDFRDAVSPDADRYLLCPVDEQELSSAVAEALKNWEDKMHWARAKKDTSAQPDGKESAAGKEKREFENKAVERPENLTGKSLIRKIENYISENYAQELKLESIARIFDYNSAYLGKIFKKNLGDNFNTYLDKVRIRAAKQLLLDEDLKVYEVSEQVGFKNIDYFYKKFRYYERKSPKEYRKQMGVILESA